MAEALETRKTHCTLISALRTFRAGLKVFYRDGLTWVSAPLPPTMIPMNVLLLPQSPSTTEGPGAGAKLGAGAGAGTGNAIAGGGAACTGTDGDGESGNGAAGTGGSGDGGSSGGGATPAHSPQDSTFQALESDTAASDIMIVADRQATVSDVYRLWSEH